MNSLKEAFSMQNLLKNLNFFGELNLGLILTAVGIVEKVRAALALKR